MLHLKCLIKALTGYNCPFCGFQRSVLALIRGDFVDAFYYNPCIYIISPYLLLLVLCVIGIIPQDSKLYKVLYGRWSISAAAIATIAWTIFRNIYHC
jgi:hypothetical protein